MFKEKKFKAENFYLQCHDSKLLLLLPPVNTLGWNDQSTVKPVNSDQTNIRLLFTGACYSVDIFTIKFHNGASQLWSL
jgi:hypothetical protein